MAFTYQPMLDEDLREQADVILRAQVVSPALENAGRRNYQVAVQAVYKGLVPVNEITVTVPGTAAPGRHHVPGAPDFAPGEETVLFLSEKANGEYGLVHLSLGAFHARRDVSGHRVFKRQLDGTHVISLPVPSRGAVNEVPRNAADFLRWLGDPAPEETAASTHLQASTTGVTEKDEFSLLGTQISRWWIFASLVPVKFYAHADGQDGMTGGGFTEFQNAIDAWVNDSGSNVLYSYGGTTTAQGGLDDPDGINSILFNDPNDEVDGTFSCSEGGVLAIGGYVNNGGLLSFLGDLFGEIDEGDIVTNDGAGCFFRGNGNTNGEEVFAHELGHTLGLGHSCEHQPEQDELDCDDATPAQFQALMRSTPHADGRGASLGSDDRAALAYLYPTEDSSTEPDPEPNTDTGNNNGGGGSGGSSGGGCTMTPGGPQAIDILMPVLLLLSALWLVRARALRGNVIEKTGDDPQ